MACEGWILLGELEGEACRPAPLTKVAGLPHALRHALALKSAGVDRVTAVWLGGEPVPDLSAVAGDDRIPEGFFQVSTAVPQGDAGDTVVMIRGDRVVHRDLAKLVTEARVKSPNTLAKIAGSEHDGVVATDRATAAAMVDAVATLGGWQRFLADKAAAGAITDVPPVWLAFTHRVDSKRALRRAEWQLISSLRKPADGLASKWINRHISLRMTWFAARTPMLPNHATVFCLLSAMIGSLFIARGTYLGAVIGFGLVNLGSIVDGVDGELSRLKYRGSKLGQWMDTVTDDISNVCFITATMIALDASGVSWAMPVALAGLGAFLFTQSVQYYYIAVVYKSGDLAAIPWAFQSTESLSARPTGLVPLIRATVPKMLKRDFVVTVFVGLAIANRVDVILLIWATGALAFFASFSLQLIRLRPSRSRMYL